MTPGSHSSWWPSLIPFCRNVAPAEKSSEHVSFPWWKEGQLSRQLGSRVLVGASDYNPLRDFSFVSVSCSLMKRTHEKCPRVCRLVSGSDDPTPVTFTAPGISALQTNHVTCSLSIDKIGRSDRFARAESDQVPFNSCP